MAGGVRQSDLDEPDAFQKLLERLKESQQVHMACDAAKEAASMAKDKGR